MKSVFADTFFFIALLNRADAAHASASQFGEHRKGRITTTRHVLLELADAFAGTPLRRETAAMIQQLLVSPRFYVISASDELFDRGLELYRRRPDKRWSLTDCISFVVMKDEGLTEALTGDRHFEQAGFLPLLRT